MRTPLPPQNSPVESTPPVSSWIAGLRSKAGDTWLLPWTGAWILGLDWLLFSQNLLTLGLATPLISIAGFFAGGAGAYMLQRFRARDSRLMAGCKALVAGVIVGVPWPILGTAIGGWVLMAAGWRRRLSSR